MDTAYGVGKIVMQTQNTDPGAFVLASVLTAYPDDRFVDSINILRNDKSVRLSDSLSDLIEKVIQEPGHLDNLRSEYIAIFDQSRDLKPLYETEYGRERSIFKASELSDIAGFYRAFGFEMDEAGTKDMVDHVSVELEFYALLLMKLHALNEQGNAEGAEIVLDGMKKFMDSHLGRFVPAILERIAETEAGHYKEIFSWVNEVVTEECSRLGVAPEMAHWLCSQAEQDNVCCGSTVPLGK